MNLEKEVLQLILLILFSLLFHSYIFSQSFIENQKKDSLSIQAFSNLIPYKSNLKNDSTLSNLSNLKKFDKSLNQLWKKKNHQKVSGKLSLLSEYGNLNSLNKTNPAQNFTLISDVNIVLLGIPLKLNTKFSPYSKDNFVRNFFKIGFDKNKFSTLVNEQKNFKSEIIDSKIHDLSNKLGNNYRQQAYFDLLSNKEYFPELPKSQSFDIITDSKFSDFENFNSTNNSTDSIINLKEDSLNIDYSTPENWNDTLTESKVAFSSKQSEILLAADSLNYQKNKCKENFVTLKNEHRVYSDYKTMLDSGMVAGNKYLSFLKGFQQGLKKFDLGLVSPNFSTFLINQTILKGINFEWETEKKSYSFAHGKTQELIQPDFEPKRNNIVRSFFNQLDPGDIENGRRVSAAKISLYKNSNTSIKVGGLYGKGKDSYWQNQSNSASSFNIEKNIVFEIEAQQKIGKISTLKLVYAKSSLNSNIDASESKGQKNNNTIKGNGAFISIINKISKTKTNFDLSARYTDQNFKSFGARFIRPGQLRFETKLTQQISKKIKIGLNGRKENTEFANTFGSSNNSLTSYGGNLGVKIFKSLHADLNIQNVENEISIEDNTLHTVGSKMYAANLFWFRHDNKIFKDANLNYNYIQFSSPESKNYLTTLTGMFTIRNDDKWSQKVDILFLQDIVPDSSISNTSMILGSLFETSISKNIKFGIGGKVGYSSSQMVWGKSGSIAYKKGKHLEISANAEKRIVDPYYSTKYFNESALYPYYYSIQLNWLW